MSDDPAWTKICAAESTLTLTPDDFCCAAAPTGSSPIDDYYEYVGHLMTLGDNTSLEASEVLCRLLLLGLVSGVEQYFRSIIAGTLRVCPISRSNAADQTIHFGALDHYGPEGIEAAVFDSASLADKTEIKKRTAALLGIPIKDTTSLSAALDEFDKVCVMRHAAVHSRGTLGRGNVRDLGLASPEGSTQILQLSFATLQTAGAACHSVVRAYNKFLFRALLERWASSGELTWDWDSDKDAVMRLTELFRSNQDAAGPQRTYDLYRSLRSTFSGAAVTS